MDIFDLLFILLFFAAIFTLGASVLWAIRGQRSRALRTLRRLGIGAGIYLAVVCLVSFATPRRVLNIGDAQCFDDWCIAVENVKTAAMNSAASHTVMLRLSSRARRRAQRENGLQVYLMDDRGRRFVPIPEPDMVPLNVLLQPGESVLAARVFNMPADSRLDGLVADHGGGFPGCFVIGENNWFHKPTIVRLDSGRP